MMKAWIASLVVCGLWWTQSLAINPEAVVIVVNASDQESIDLGEYYAQRREVPVVNIVRLKVSEEETISWDVYLDQIYNPLMTWLLDASWLEGFDSKRTDEIGRRKRLIDSHRIEALVVCKGIPLRITNDPARLPPKENYPTKIASFYSNRASVDSELAALPFPKARIDAYFGNPLFRRTKPNNIFDLKPLVVGRLDGPSYALAKELVDNAIEAENEGIAGRAYIDSTGPHKMGDDWFDAAKKIIDENGFEMGVHDESGRFNLVDRFDEPLFYFGWYSGGIDGPFTHYDFKFPVGAIALHIHSFTASSVRSGHKQWVGPLVARGVTATFGNTSEPYLYFTHQPHLFLEGLFKGLTTGEAALYSIPSLSWVGVFFGDPLYKPPLEFKMSPKNEYDVLRTANLARRAGDSSAFKAALYEHDRTHHFSTGLWLHNYFLEQGNSEKAYEHLSSSYRPDSEDPRNWGILLEIAEAYLQLSNSEEALPLIEDLLERTKSKREAHEQLLNRLVKLALEYELNEHRTAWQAELDKWARPTEGAKKSKKD